MIAVILAQLPVWSAIIGAPVRLPTRLPRVVAMSPLHDSGPALLDSRGPSPPDEALDATTPVQVAVGVDNDDRRTESSGRMPLPVVVAIGCESLLLLMNAIGILIAVRGGDDLCVIINGIRSGVELGAIIGYACGVDIVRKASIVLTGAYLLLNLAVGTLLAVFGICLIWKYGVPGKDTIMLAALLHAVFVVCIMLYGAIISCLLTSSARNHFQKRSGSREPPQLHYSEA